jgi:hypothetical protein
VQSAQRVSSQKAGRIREVHAVSRCHVADTVRHGEQRRFKDDRRGICYPCIRQGHNPVLHARFAVHTKFGAPFSAVTWEAISTIRCLLAVRQKEDPDSKVRPTCSMPPPLPSAHSRPHRIEDLEIALDTALKVNRHLNYEVEKLVREVDRIEKEKAAWKKHAMGLATQLADARKLGAGDTVEKEAVALAQLPQQQYAPEPAFSWPATHPLLEEVLARGKQAGWLVHHKEVRPAALPDMPTCQPSRR